MVVRIGWILELASHEGLPIRRRQFLGFSNSSFHALRIRGAGDLGAEGPHDHDFFLRKALRHEQHDAIAAIHSHQGETDTSVSRRRFHDDRTRTQAPFLFGPLNDADGRAILHAAARIQILEFGKNIRRGGLG